MHEPLFAACLRGAAAVLSLARTTLDAAGTAAGKTHRSRTPTPPTNCRSPSA